jgi:hypothetical protein
LSVPNWSNISFTSTRQSALFLSLVFLLQEREELALERELFHHRPPPPVVRNPRRQAPSVDFIKFSEGASFCVPQESGSGRLPEPSIFSVLLSMWE